MMDRKPWQDKGLRRSFDGDEGGERRRLGRFDRFDREDRSARREFGARPVGSPRLTLPAPLEV